MKRVLPVILALVLALALMIVPAFADTVYTGTLVDYDLVFEVVPPAGSYLVQFTGDYGAYSGVVNLVDEGSSLGAELGEYGPWTFCYLSITYDGFGSIYCENDDGEMPLYPASITLTPYVPSDGSGSTVADSLLAVFSGFGTWLVSQLVAVVALFYTAEGGLTLLGVLAVAALGVAVALLLISFIASFFRFRR